MTKDLYDDLRAMAHRIMAGHDARQTLQPTALVHEAWMQLVRADPEAATNRDQVFMVAANLMRQILIDAARSRTAVKRGRGWIRSPIDLDAIPDTKVAEAVLAVDESLQKLAESEPRVAEVVKLKYFGGMTHPEVAEAMGLSPRTVDSYWAYGKAWMATALTDPVK